MSATWACVWCELGSAVHHDDDSGSKTVHSISGLELVHVMMQNWVSGSLDQEVLDTLTQWSTELTG